MSVSCSGVTVSVNGIRASGPGRIILNVTHERRHRCDHRRDHEDRLVGGLGDDVVPGALTATGAITLLVCALVRVRTLVGPHHGSSPPRSRERCCWAPSPSSSAIAVIRSCHPSAGQPCPHQCHADRRGGCGPAHSDPRDRPHHPTAPQPPQASPLTSSTRNPRGGPTARWWTARRIIAAVRH